MKNGFATQSFSKSEFSSAVTDTTLWMRFIRRSSDQTPPSAHQTQQTNVLRTQVKLHSEIQQTTTHQVHFTASITVNAHHKSQRQRPANVLTSPDRKRAGARLHLRPDTFASLKRAASSKLSPAELSAAHGSPLPVRTHLTHVGGHYFHRSEG